MFALFFPFHTHASFGRSTLLKKMCRLPHSMDPAAAVRVTLLNQQFRPGDFIYFHSQFLLVGRTRTQETHGAISYKKNNCQDLPVNQKQVFYLREGASNFVHCLFSVFLTKQLCLCDRQKWNRSVNKETIRVNNLLGCGTKTTINGLFIKRKIGSHD